MNHDLIRQTDLVENPTPRVPICLCLDASGSMAGTPMDELNLGVKMFYDALKEDEIAMFSAEISVVSFGHTVDCMADFGSLARVNQAPVLTPNGFTPMGEGVNMALDALDARKKEYQDKGVDYFQPWLVLMTDGVPNGNRTELDRAIQRTTTLVEDRKLTIFPIGIGAEADMAVLQQFSPTRQPLRLRGLKFKEFFQWLSQSVAQTSRSMPGETVKLNTEKIADWGQL